MDNQQIRKNTNMKCENLKNKIDLLIMNKTKNISQDKFPTLPSESVIDSSSSSINNHSSTVENVEHLLESMFQSTNTSKSTKLIPSPVTKHSNKSTLPRPSIEKLSNEAIEKILRTPSPVEDIIETSQNIINSSSTNNHDKLIKSTSNNNYSMYSPTLTSNVSNINSNTSPTTSNKSLNYTINNTINSNNTISSNNSNINNTSRKRLRKKSSIDSDSSISSNDSNQLQIIDDSIHYNLNHSLNELNNIKNELNLLNDDLDINSSKNDLNIDNNKMNNELLNTHSVNNDSICSSSSHNNKNNQDNNNGNVNLNLEVKKEINGIMTTATTNGNIKIKDEKESPNKLLNLSSSSTNTSLNNIINTNQNQTILSNPINVVENELEKMFAGIVQSEETNMNILDNNIIKNENINEPEINKSSIKTSSTTINKKRKQSTSTNRRRQRRSSEFFSPSSPETIPSINISSSNNNKKINKNSNKRKSSSNKMNINCTSSKDNSNDSINNNKNKISPCIRIYQNNNQNRKNNYLIINNSNMIINDDEINTSSIYKKSNFVANKKNKSSCNSLMPLSRTDVTDHTWHCVFCKKGPNLYGCAGNPLGDLFGPYLISAPQATYLDSDEFKRRASRTASGKIENVKIKRPISIDSESTKLTSGLIKITSSSSDSTSPNKKHKVQYEIWAHEPCLTWTSGIYLVGASLMGLEEAVWAALNSVCVNCGENGASIGCVKSKCRGSVHYSCALHIGWYLDPLTFIASCSIHREKYSTERYLDSKEKSVI